ncbi:hypothetical protein [Granulicoccus phenolivorans]|uniref:hypothetical protein n=1 Tax=Granulicoccus phenolivorans TaxID=266854 RepID=UPI000413915C|nr:hypothetical protein [Granulicoccus phenolivorans]
MSAAKRRTRQQRSNRNYGVRFGGSALVYTVLILVSIPLAEQFRDSPVRFVIVSLPIIGIAGGIWALWSYLREADEFQVRKLLEALAFSIALTVLVTFTYGMWELVGAPRLSMVWVTAVWAIGLGIGSLLANRKYR